MKDAKKVTKKERPITPLRAIRLHCRQCGTGTPKEVRLCPIKDCNLYAYRRGTNPARAKIGPGMVIKTNPEHRKGDPARKSAAKYACRGIWLKTRHI